MKKKKFNPRVTRRQMLKIGFIGGGAMFLPWKFKLPKAFAEIPGGTLLPEAVPKYQTPMLIPPVMPKAGTIMQQGGKKVDYYEISMKQFNQQILPAGLPAMGERSAVRSWLMPGRASNSPMTPITGLPLP